MQSRFKEEQIIHNFAPQSSPLTESGWNEDDGTMPPLCLSPPAPEVLELLKCGCKTGCYNACSCRKNKLLCTALCKAYEDCCTNYDRESSSKDVEDDEDFESNELDELFMPKLMHQFTINQFIEF